MGAWDTTSFGNDTACDWLAELIDSGSSDMIADAFDSVISADGDFIESSTGEEAVAAAEVLAWLQGRPGPSSDATEGLDDWMEEQEEEEYERLLKKGRKTLDIVAGDQSELKEIWEESGELEDWAKSIADLKVRLRES